MPEAHHHDDKDRSRSRSHGRHHEDRDRDRERRRSRSRSRDRRWGLGKEGSCGLVLRLQVSGREIQPPSNRAAGL